MNKNAKWITAPRDMGVAATTFRRELTCNKEIKKATLCVSSMGNYALFLNGERVGKGVLAPGWTSYKTRVLYQTYDLTSLLRAENRLEISVGQGWAVGYIGHVNTNHCFAERTAVVAWLHIRYADGTEEELVTIIDTIEEEGLINEEQGELLQSTLDFRDTTVEKIMTPRIDMTAMDIDSDEEKIAAMRRAYREKNREKVLASEQAYREANREKLRAYQREYQKEYRRRKKENVDV